jgi:hypothetical protein
MTLLFRHTRFHLDFICPHALPGPTTTQLAAMNAAWEQDVRAIRIRSQAATAWIGEADRSSGSGGQFPPGQFFAEAGTVIAVCLGFALLARILLTAV